MRRLTGTGTLRLMALFFHPKRQRIQAEEAAKQDRFAAYHSQPAHNGTCDLPSCALDRTTRLFHVFAFAKLRYAVVPNKGLSAPFPVNKCDLPTASIRRVCNHVKRLPGAPSWMGCRRVKKHPHRRVFFAGASLAAAVLARRVFLGAGAGRRSAGRLCKFTDRSDVPRRHGSLGFFLNAVYERLRSGWYLLYFCRNRIAEPC